MEFLPSDPFLELPPDTLEVVRRDVNLHRAGEMLQAVHILDQWVKQQAHFIKKDFPLQYLESAIIVSKGSIERAKVIMDKMCSIRTMMPEYFQPYDIEATYREMRGNTVLAVLPQLTDEYYRIAVVKVTTCTPKILECIYRHAYISMDYIRLHDYHTGGIMIFDAVDADLSEWITNVNFVELRNVMKVMLEAYGLRCKRCHFITPSKLAETLFNTLFKPFFKKKLTDRVVINRTVDELLEYYPRRVLPKNYGGEERSLEELMECGLEVLSSEHMGHMKSMVDARTDEELRPAGHFNEEFAGTMGTFRTLNID